MKTLLASKSPFNDAEAGHTARRFGMAIFLISLGVLFIATVIGFVVVRVQITRRGAWPDDLPPLPRSLWLGTFVLILSSLTMHAALVFARRSAAGGDGARVATVRALIVTTALGVLFLLVQVGGWFAWLAVVREHWVDSEPWRLALMGFYLLSGLHAAHVVGGLAGLSVTTWRARHYYESARLPRAVLHCASYWHFLLVVWVALYALLLATL